MMFLISRRREKEKEIRREENERVKSKPSDIQERGGKGKRKEKGG